MFLYHHTFLAVKKDHGLHVKRIMVYIVLLCACKGLHDLSTSIKSLRVWSVGGHINMTTNYDLISFITWNSKLFINSP
jgi:hypothetical protein